MACALDICDPEWVISAEVYPIVPLQGDEYEDDLLQAECKLENMARAIAQFGDEDNDVQPKANGSYLFLANAPITLGHWGDLNCSDCCDTRTEHMPDPWANQEIEGRKKNARHDRVQNQAQGPRQRRWYQVQVRFHVRGLGRHPVVPNAQSA